MAKKKVMKKQEGKLALNQSKFNLVLKNLILFTTLLIISLLLYKVSTEEIYVQLFSILSIISGFIAVAFLVALLIFVFIRMLKK